MNPKRKSIFFTSDWHISSGKSIEFDKRPFTDVRHMHQVLINNYNSVVPKNGICYFLGDIGVGDVETTKKVIDQLNGIKVLILGNHDKGMNRMYDAGFNVVIHGATLKIAGATVTLSHYPLAGVFRENTSGMKGCMGKEHWHGEMKYKEITFPDRGQLHICGHIHSPNKGRSIKSLGRQLDIGVVSNKYTPVHISKIESWAAKTKILADNWKEILEYPGYKINCLGDIKSFRKQNIGVLKKFHKDKDGYLCLGLRKNNKSKTTKLHRLVAETFIHNPNNLPQVNHKSGHKLDNSINNLEWVSHTENQHHAWDTGLKVVKLTVSCVSEIKKLLKSGISEHKSLLQAT